MVAGGFGIEENLWKEKEKARFKKCKYEIEKEKKKDCVFVKVSIYWCALYHDHSLFHTIILHSWIEPYR